MDRFNDVRDPRLRTLCSNWLALRGPRRMPSRVDLDPTGIPAVLPYVWLYDFEPPDRFRCRLIGEEVKRLYTPSPRGRYIDEIFPADHAIEVTARFQRIVQRCQAMHTHGWCKVAEDQQVHGERVTLPLSSDGVRPDALVGATIYALGQGAAAARLLSEDHESQFFDI